MYLPLELTVRISTIIMTLGTVCLHGKKQRREETYYIG